MPPIPTMRMLPSVRLFLLATCVITLAIACRKDADTPATSGGSGPTPALPGVPQWVLDSVGPFAMPADNPLTVQGIALGRRLFYETALSDNYTLSCSSCHKQDHGFTDPLPFSVGTNGAVGTRSAMAITDLGWDHFFFWDGRRPSFEAQAHDPVTNPIEMRNTWPEVVLRLQADPDYPGLFEGVFGTSTIDSTMVVRAIAQFERTLLSFNSRYDRFRFLGDSTALNTSEQRGLDLFTRDAHCTDCHREPWLSDGFLRNNGLDIVPADSGRAGVTGNAADLGKFKVPTLRNIAASPPYMHDNRFATLEEVLDFYANNVQVTAPTLDAHMSPWQLGTIDLDAQDQADITAFLRALTDSTFLTNPAFGPP